MNNILKEFAKQAGMEPEEDGVVYWISNEDLTTFAKLMIAECTYIASTSDGDGPDIADEIRKFFK